MAVRRAAPPAWGLMAVLAVGVAGYALSFQFRGIDAFGVELLASFYRRPWAIWFHMVFGAIALVAGALNFRHDLRRARPAVHRRIGEAYVLASWIGAAAGLWLAMFAFGGLASRLGFSGLALATLVTTTMAFAAARRRDFPTHRAWMIRSYALMLAAVTLRLQLPVLASALQGFAPAYVIVAWSCWVPNLIAAEWIVRATTRRPGATPRAPSPATPRSLPA
ncbi:MAG: DUF2306 domain-containing protein [Gemmatimonadaceae bacterium]|nr:DUF2306 domain-containing protein [Gemmatimonadaceae bacterium]